MKKTRMKALLLGCICAVTTALSAVPASAATVVAGGSSATNDPALTAAPGTYTEQQSGGTSVDKPSAPPTVWVVGDSTAAAFNDTTYYSPRYGWGTQLGLYLQGVNIRNLAISGTSSKSYSDTDQYQTLLQSVQAEPIRRWAGLDAEHLQDAVGWEVFLWENPTRQAAAPSAAPVPAQRAGEELPFDAAQLDWVYPHAASAVIPSKVTATQLKGRALDQEIAENAAPERRVRAVSFEKPRFLQKKRGLTAAERGTAMHLAMQFLPLDTPAAPEAVTAFAERLTARRLLTPEQAAALDIPALARFLASSLAERIRTAPQVWREYRFALLTDAGIYDVAAAGEEILLQGVADCVFETTAGLTVVDFKTDRVTAAEASQRAEAYRPQLDAYAGALSRILEKPVTERILYFFACGEEISL